MKQEGNHIIADKGKVFRYKGTEEFFGNEIYLGYIYYLEGVLLDPPHLCVAEDFEEIDDTSELTPEEALAIITGQDNE